MIKDINIRFNPEKDEHKKAWDYMQNMAQTIEKFNSKVKIRMPISGVMKHRSFYLSVLRIC